MAVYSLRCLDAIGWADPVQAEDASAALIAAHRLSPDRSPELWRADRPLRVIARDKQHGWLPAWIERSR